MPDDRLLESQRRAWRREALPELPGRSAGGLKRSQALQRRCGDDREHAVRRLSERRQRRSETVEASRADGDAGADDTQSGRHKSADTPMHPVPLQTPQRTTRACAEVSDTAAQGCQAHPTMAERDAQLTGVAAATSAAVAVVGRAARVAVDAMVAPWPSAVSKVASPTGTGMEMKPVAYADAKLDYPPSW